MARDIESKVRNYRDVSAVIAVLFFILFPLNAYLLVTILKLSFYAAFATQISIQALTILNIFLGAVLYRRHLKKEVNAAIRITTTNESSSPEVKDVTTVKRTIDKVRAV